MHMFADRRNTCENRKNICESQRHMRKLCLYLWICKTHVKFMDICLHINEINPSKYVCAFLGNCVTFVSKMNAGVS